MPISVNHLDRFVIQCIHRPYNYSNYSRLAGHEWANLGSARLDCLRGCMLKMFLIYNRLLNTLNTLLYVADTRSRYYIIYRNVIPIFLRPVESRSHLDHSCITYA